MPKSEELMAKGITFRQGLELDRDCQEKPHGWSRSESKGWFHKHHLLLLPACTQATHLLYTMEYIDMIKLSSRRSRRAASCRRTFIESDYTSIVVRSHYQTNNCYGTIEYNDLVQLSLRSECEMPLCESLFAKTPHELASEAL